MHQSIFLAVRDPDFAGAGRRDGRCQPVPVGMIGDDQRQRHAVLARPRADAHPAGRERSHRIRKAPGPDVAQRGRRAYRDGAGKLGFVGAAHRTQFAERDAAARVITGDAFHRAMQIDRRGMASLAQQRDDALRLTERIRADQMRALREQSDGVEQLRNLLIRIAMAEDRERKGRLGDEHIALHQLERHARRVGHVLVVAGSHDAQVAGFDGNLRRTEHMAGRMKRHFGTAQIETLRRSGSPGWNRRSSRRSEAA